ncbi:hypothetical protein N7470_008464 [Penicillium chermesinum]|nr:hypothetical protein N7470_008464 [Penicillium chermesinum]
MDIGKLLRFPGSCKKPTLAPDKSSNTAGALVNESQSQRPVKTQKHRSRRRPKPTTRKTPQSLLANSDTGFAQFLREHTTSQHQRVTAGGQIVPMSNEQSEQREHPRLNDEQPDVMPAARPQWRFGDFDTGGEPREIVELQREIDALRRRGRANVELTAGDPDNSMLGEPHDPSPTDRELSPESLEYRNLRSLLRHPRPRIPYAWECPGFEFAQVVRGYFTTDDPYGEIEWEWEYILRQEIDFHTPPDHLSMHLDRASSGESFSPRGFRMSLNWAVLHYSLSVEGLIELRMHLNTLWEDFSFLLSQITQHIASVEVPASELYEFRRMYIRLREEVSQWMYRAGDMIRYVDPLYSDQYDTDTEWEEEGVSRT